MARPKKLTLDFFVHSANARHDRRIKSLRRRENNDGYATYYILLEMSCSEKEMKLHLDNEIIVEDIADECGLRDIAHLYKVIESCVSVGLFNSQLWRSERIIFSDDLYNSYLDRLEDRKATAERKQRSIPEFSWKATRKIVFERDNYTCVYCGATDKPLHCDHIHPVSKGGTNDVNNLATSCQFCNTSKGSKTIDEWRKSQ